MSDMNFEERCPCGASIKTSGYESRIAPQIEKWHHTHDKHANAIAKSLAEGVLAEKLQWPLYYIPSIAPGTVPWGPPIITNFEGNSNARQETKS